MPRDSVPIPVTIFLLSISQMFSDFKKRFMFSRFDDNIRSFKVENNLHLNIKI